VLDIYSSLSLIWRYSYCPVFQGATSADEQCTHVLTEEDFFSTEEREGVDRCIGVICSSVSDELFPNVPEYGGIGYQFLYEGDELKCYEHGLLIESVE
ncbi:hypothetical protein ACQ93S_22820, partial [Escherichia coli]